MIPKVGNIVRFSNDFIEKFLEINVSSFIYQDWKKYFLKHRGKDIEVINTSISPNLNFIVGFYVNNESGKVEINREGVLVDWENEITIPIFTADRTSEKALSHLYCSCGAPKIKKVFISAILQ